LISHKCNRICTKQHHVATFFAKLNVYKMVVMNVYLYSMVSEKSCNTFALNFWRQKQIKNSNYYQLEVQKVAYLWTDWLYPNFWWWQIGNLPGQFSWSTKYHSMRALISQYLPILNIYDIRWYGNINWVWFKCTFIINFEILNIFSILFYNYCRPFESNVIGRTEKQNQRSQKIWFA
jgi:hypothetical protein